MAKKPDYFDSLVGLIYWKITLWGPIFFFFNTTSLENYAGAYTKYTTFNVMHFKLPCLQRENIAYVPFIEYVQMNPPLVPKSFAISGCFGEIISD